MTKPRNRGHAGGYQIVQGCARYPNFKNSQRKPWIRATKAFLVRQLLAGDWDTCLLVRQAHQELGMLSARPMSNRGGTPLERAQAIIGNIVKQGKAPVIPGSGTWKRRRFTPLDIVIAALATDIMYRHWEGTPLRTPYYRAVQIGKAIHYLLRHEVRVYEVEDGHGGIRRTVLKQRIGLSSRNVCQRLQQLTEKIYGEYMAKHGSSIASHVLNATHTNASRMSQRVTTENG